MVMVFVNLMRLQVVQMNLHVTIMFMQLMEITHVRILMVSVKHVKMELL